jgi:hypothetical protein
MIRSNPGLMILKKGTIVRKFHSNNIPSLQSLESDLGEGPASTVK